MSRSAGIVIWKEMARHYSTQDALDIIMHTDSEDDSSSSESASSDSEDDCDSEVSDVETNHSRSSSAEESSGDEGEEGEAGWTSKNGTVWSPTNLETLRFVPAARGLIPGPTSYAAARIMDPLSSFSLLLTPEILQHVMVVTNTHGTRVMPDWRDLDAEELQAYVGLLILAGVYRSKSESTLSLWSEKWGRAIFRATMSMKRFHQISRAIRFDDKLSRRRNDKLAAFRGVWDMWTYRLPMLFNPDRDVCVDEQLVPFKGRCGFRQYMPKKPAKYGIKIWATCDVDSSYAWRLQIYTGKEAGRPAETNQGMRVVLEMTEGLQGNVVTCDNFFTSYALSEELLRRKLALVGTIRRNKPELPPHLLQARARAIFSSTFAFTKNHTLVSYIPRRGKNVLLLSTLHRSPDISADPKRKPTIIQDYNRCKGGVDNLDKVVGTYSCRRRTNRWPLALFHNVIDVSLYNAFVLWTAVEPSWQQRRCYRRRLFIQEVAEALVAPHTQRRERLPRSSAAAAVVVDMQSAAAGPSSLIREPKRRRVCELCTGKKRRVVSTCSKCAKFSCKDHSLVICSLCST